MSCPICSHTELEAGAENCPKCGSDLEIFTHIDAVHKAETFQRKSMLVLTAMLGIVMVSWGSVSLFSGDNKEANEIAAVAETTDADAVVAPNEDPLNLAAATKPVEELVAENEVKPEVAPLNKEAEVKPEVKAEVKAKAEAKKSAVKEKAKSVGPTFDQDGYIFHKVRKGDSFWKISKRYFGNGNRAKQIAADNNLNPKKNIPLGTKLKINK